MNEDIQRILGRIEEKQDTTGREIRELKADVRNIKETCLRREAPFKRMERHIETDLPNEVREGQHAKAFLKWAAVVIATTVINQLPAIVGFLSVP